MVKLALPRINPERLRNEFIVFSFRLGERTTSRFFASDATLHQEHLLNLGVEIILLIAYGLYLVFMPKTHPEFFTAAGAQEEHHGEVEQWGMPEALPQ